MNKISHIKLWLLVEMANFTSIVCEFMDGKFYKFLNCPYIYGLSVILTKFYYFLLSNFRSRCRSLWRHWLVKPSPWRWSPLTPLKMWKPKFKTKKVIFSKFIRIIHMNLFQWPSGSISFKEILAFTVDKGGKKRERSLNFVKISLILEKKKTFVSTMRES